MGYDNHHMGAADLAVFGVTLLISAATGVYFAWKDRNKKSTEQYYFGGGKMSPIPVAASIAVSYFSAIAVIGESVEIYLHGAVFEWFLISLVLSTLIAVVYFVPIYHKLKVKSLYEYLELRFNTSVRKLTSFLELVGLVIYLGSVVYVPSLALSAVTHLKLELAIAITTIVCTFYTTIGGLKAVVWTDLIQAIILISGLLAVFAKVVLSVGGFRAVISAVERGGRNNFFTYDFDPRKRSTTWTLLFGLGVLWCHSTCCNQVYVQRYLSCRTVTSARAALLMSLVPVVILNLSVLGIGLALYAYFEGCDPLLSGKITKIDQAVPLMAAEIFNGLPGMNGLFVSAIFCGTLSSVSSGINSMASMTLVDFIAPCFSTMTSTRAMAVSQVLTLAYGLIVLLLAYLISMSTSNIIQVVYALSGFVLGPIVGVFIMGVFMPWINNKGAFAGLGSGFAISSWIGLSSMFSTELLPLAYETLPLSIDDCTLDHSIFSNVSASTPQVFVAPSDYTSWSTMENESRGSLLHQTLYSISPFLHALVGLLVCIIFGHLVSFITGVNKPSESDPKLFAPIVNIKLLRFGVPENEALEKNIPIEEKAQLAEKQFLREIDI